MPASVQREVGALCAAVPEVAWSVCVRDAEGVVASVNDAVTLRIASVGKLLLLLAAAQRIVAEPDFAKQELMRPRRAVADSGLWQHLDADSLTVADACVLVASVSDNLATNALIDEIGLAACEHVAMTTGCSTLALHDVVRDVRTADDEPTLATGSSADLAEFMWQLMSPPPDARDAAELLSSWLTLSVDHSMALRELGLDPLISGHDAITLRNKTGSDAGVRADVGIITTESTSISYAIVANWVDADVSPRDVQQAMGRVIEACLRSTF